MNKGYLSEYFTGVGTKMLTLVDASENSNQHEIGDGQNGQILMRILGNKPRKGKNRFAARYIWLNDEQESISVEGFLSWYDTRENQPDRGPEWRLYYQTNVVTKAMDEGDRLFVAAQPNDCVFFIVVPGDSYLASQISWLFGLDIQHAFESFGVKKINGSHNTKLDFISRFMLDEIGVEFEDPDANSLDAIVERFGMNFPRTAEFSELARLTLPEVDARDDPDAALLAWLNHEEAMFRRLEKRIVANRVLHGFMEGGGVDVDAFIQYSLSVQNRRKSRMGHSLENQLKAVFDAFDLQYDSQVVTENRKKPDFIFPGKKEYEDQEFRVELLTMLAAKSTCKDRWPQILPEAKRILKKHLVTLELGISASQTETMKSSNVQLIVPEALHYSFSTDQQNWLWSITRFVDVVSSKQAGNKGGRAQFKLPFSQ